MKEKIFLAISIMIFQISILAYLNTYENYLKADVSKDKPMINIREVKNNIDSANISKVSNESTYRKDIYLENEEKIMRDEYNKNTNIKINTSDKKEIFKMDAEIIVKNLTSKEIRDILKLSKSLNMKEFIQMKDYLFEPNREKALLDAINLLQDALTEEEYEDAKKIANRFIYVDVAEKLAENATNLN